VVHPRQAWTFSKFAALLGILLLALAPGSIAGIFAHEGATLLARAADRHEIQAAPAPSDPAALADCAEHDRHAPSPGGGPCCSVTGCQPVPAGMFAEPGARGTWPPPARSFPASRTSVPAGIGALPLVRPPRGSA
jgi:hypothetical protein